MSYNVELNFYRVIRAIKIHLWPDYKSHAEIFAKDKANRANYDEGQCGIKKKAAIYLFQLRMKTFGHLETVFARVHFILVLFGCKNSFRLKPRDLYLKKNI